jgi:hypothetical protein
MKILHWFITCWFLHMTSCSSIGDDRADAICVGSSLRIGCWNPGNLVSQDTPNFRNHNGRSCFLGSPSWTTIRPCTKHRISPWIVVKERFTYAKFYWRLQKDIKWNKVLRHEIGLDVRFSEGDSVFWILTPSSSERARRFGGNITSIFRVEE